MLPWSVIATAGMPERLHPRDQLRDLVGAVEQRVLRVQMQMDEGHRRARSSRSVRLTERAPVPRAPRTVNRESEENRRSLDDPAPERRGGGVASKLGDLLTAAGMKVEFAEQPEPAAPARRDRLRRRQEARRPSRAQGPRGQDRDRRGRHPRVASALERMARDCGVRSGGGERRGRMPRVQGDLVARVERWLVEHGAPKVVVGD